MIVPSSALVAELLHWHVLRAIGLALLAQEEMFPAVEGDAVGSLHSKTPEAGGILAADKVLAQRGHGML